MFRLCVLILLATISSVKTGLVPSTDPQCQPSNFNPFPTEDIYYVLPGDSVTIMAKHNTYGTINFRNNSDRQTIQCTTAPQCDLDQNSGQLTINDFQSSYAGSYNLSFLMSNAVFCRFVFNLTEAMVPTLVDNARTRTIDSDAGLLLAPTVQHGLPEGVVQWYKDGQKIFEGDAYTVPRVDRSHRGIYIANISNSAGGANITYTVFVNFHAVIDITSDPPTANQSDSTDSVTITCTALAYPVIDSIQLYVRANGREERVSTGINPVINNQFQNDSFGYEASLTYEVSGCPISEYTCNVVNNNRALSANNSIAICQRTPTVSNFTIDANQSTNSSVTLQWSLNPIGVSVISYTFQYRREGSLDWQTCVSGTKCPATNFFCQIDGLSSGVIYEFRMKATNSVGDGQYTEHQTFQTYAVPQGMPRGLNVNRNIVGQKEQITLSWQAVTALDYAPVSAYHVLYHTDTNSTITLKVTTGLMYLLTENINPNNTYTFIVRAYNMWGYGRQSAPIQSTKTSVIDPNADRVTVRLTVEVSADSVVVRWRIMGIEYVQNITIQIRLLENTGPNSVTTHLIHTYNIPSVNANTPNHVCFQSLNSSETYNFCAVAVLTSTTNKSHCVFVSTTSRDRQLADANDCRDVGQPLIGEALLPTWSIAVIVVSSVLLVFFGFGGCGLYFGIKRTKKGSADLDSPQASMEDVNGYPYQSKRGPSPSRSCMSYRHNQQHQHVMDWRVTNPVERQDFTEV